MEKCEREIERGWGANSADGWEERGLRNNNNNQ